MSEDESDLVRRCAAGDEGALCEIMERHSSLMNGLAYRYLGNREDADEVTVSAFIRFWQTARRFRSECSLRAYLCRIVLNECGDRKRKIKRSPTSSSCSPFWDSGTRTGEERGSLNLGMQPSSLGQTHNIGRIRDAIQQLNPADRRLVVLYYMDLLSYEEICSACDISYDVLKTRLTRARARLRKIMGLENEER